MWKDGIHIAPQKAYLKSVTGNRPITRDEALELIELFKEVRMYVTDPKVKWYISREISDMLKKVMRGEYESGH